MARQVSALYKTLDEHKPEDIIKSLFESSYNELLSIKPKSSLLKALNKRITALIEPINKNLEPPKLVMELERIISDKLRIGEDVNFGVDFALGGEGDCVVFADIFFSALYVMKRYDVLDKLRVHYNHNGTHVWLSYRDIKGTIKINDAYFSPKRTGRLPLLLSYNLNNLGVTLENMGKLRAARSAYKTAIELAPYSELPRLNLEDSY